MNGLPPSCLEQELFNAAMDDDDEKILEWFLQMTPVQRKGLVWTVRHLLGIIAPLEPKTWRGIKSLQLGQFYAGLAHAMAEDGWVARAK